MSTIMARVATAASGYGGWGPGWGWGGWGWGGYGGWGYPYSSIDVHNYTERSLVIDIYDTRTNQPVWHGVAKKNAYTDDVNYAKLDETIAAVLGRFPATARHSLLTVRRLRGAARLMLWP